MTRKNGDITKTLRRVLKRARRACTASEVYLTPADYRVVHDNLIPAAIAYAQGNGRRLPAFAVLCGCRVFLRTSIAGEVIVSPGRDAVPLAMSGPFRA